MTIKVFFSAIGAHRGLAIDELVFDLIDGDLHRLPLPEPGLEGEEQPPPSLRPWLSAEPRNHPCIPRRYLPLHPASLGTNHPACVLPAPLLAATPEKGHPDSGPGALRAVLLPRDSGFLREGGEEKFKKRRTEPYI